MEPLEPMRPVSVHAPIQTSTPRWKSAAAMLGTMCVFAYALLSTRTGAGPVVMGVAVGVVGIVLYAMSISRTLRENSGKRIPMWGAPPVSPREMDLLAGVGMPLFAAGTLTALRASGMNWSYLFLGLCVMVSVLALILPALIHNSRVKRAPAA
ncbi:UNVERIFIED_ORG: hypothetical protein FNL38_103273 [Nocardia globerula]|uniref:Uncharacterized protein n=1 Tax=Nocardia globerula TaxID=1818 RepID=A0A652YQY0_NOCGL|nr:hypothetical protein [Rhodococcus globerulus]NMD63485.1 hypothetical protein [Nocardia globerula]PVX63050.1 hypothetical protein C8E04_0302 [Rhodococcus globerulus]